MQSIKPVVRKINTLPQRKEFLAKQPFKSSNNRMENEVSSFEKSLEVEEVKHSPRKNKLPHSVFRARTFRSLLDEDDDEDDDENEKDMLALKLANPVHDENESILIPSRLTTMTSGCQSTTVLLSWSDRLTEDELKGFSLGGLILI
eukprot:scaffold22575_cov141-Cylindrotheca_fusiformis.AAC.20